MTDIYSAGLDDVKRRLGGPVRIASTEGFDRVFRDTLVGSVRDPFVIMLKKIACDPERQKAHNDIAAARKSVFGHKNLPPGSPPPSRAKINKVIELYSNDAMEGSAVIKKRLEQMLKGRAVPLPNSDIPEWVQLANDFGLTGEERATFIEAGQAYYDKYAKKAEHAASKPEKPAKAPIQKATAATTEMGELLKFIQENYRCVSNKVVPGKPRGGEKSDEFLNKNNLLHRIGVTPTALSIISGRFNGSALAGKKNEVERSWDNIVVFLKCLNIADDDPLVGKFREAFEHDLAAARQANTQRRNR